MDFQLTKDDEKLRQSFAELCEKELKPAAEKVDRQGQIPESHWRALADIGYLGFAFDPEFGGKGKTLALWACLAEHLARCCPSTYAAVAVSSHIFGGMIHLFGSPAQKAKYLPGLCAGKIKAAVALTDTKEGAEGAEGAAGWTTAEPAGDEFAISGTKPYVINGPICDAALVSARIGSAGNHRAALFLVDADLPGLVRSERQATLGVRGAHIGSLEFTRCLVRNENILGGEGGAEKALTALHARQCLWWAIYGVGVGQASIDAAKNHAGSRLIAGKRIAKHQEVHMKIAEMHMYTDTARLLALKAAWQLDQGSAEDGIAQSAKILATEMAARCSHQALQIHGGKGYFQGEPIERIFRDARLGELAGETSEILRGELAAGVFAQFRS